MAASNYHASFGIFSDDVEMENKKPEFYLYVGLFLNGLVVSYESGF